MPRKTSNPYITDRIPIHADYHHRHKVGPATLAYWLKSYIEQENDWIESNVNYMDADEYHQACAHLEAAHELMKFLRLELAASKCYGPIL
jgi:hypothetical protein